MKWNQKRIRENVDLWAKAAKTSVPEIKSADDAVAFVTKVAETHDIPGLVDGGEVNEQAVRDAWGRKTVEITFNSQEDDVVATDLAAEQADEMDEDEDTDAKAEGEDDPEDETKTYRQKRKAFFRSTKSNTSSAIFAKSVEQAARESKGAFGMARTAAMTDRMAERKSYDRKAQSGETAYSCSDVAEVAGAWYRHSWLSGTKHHDYAFRAYDEDVLTKAGSVFDNSLGGFLVPETFANEMIELKAQHGVARQLSPVVVMPTPKWSTPRFEDDVVVYKTAEGQAMTESDVTFSQVTLLSEEIAAFSRQSNRLVNLSPIAAADTFSRSASRATGKYEDDSFFNGANGFEGLASKIGATSTLDVTSATAFSSVTLDQLLEWKSKLPAYVDNFTVDEIPITCTRPVFEQVFRKYALAQGGADDEALLAAGKLRFDGHPIVLNNSMARTFSNGVIAAYIGPFRHVTKVGELQGSMRVDSSEQRYFERNQMAFRALQEIAINCHDVNNTTESGVIALKYST